MDVPDWNREMDTSVSSMFLTATFGPPLLEKSQERAIVKMASASGHVASVDYPACVMTMAALEGSTTALSQAAGDRSIRIHAVAPCRT